MLNEKFELITALLSDLDEDLHEIHDFLADYENEYYMNSHRFSYTIKIFRINIINYFKEYIMA